MVHLLGRRELLDVPIPRRARKSVLLASAALLTALLAPAASAGASGAMPSATPTLMLAEPVPTAGESPSEAGKSPSQDGENARREARAREREARAQERRAAHCQLTVEASAQRITAAETVNVFGKLLCPEATSAGERQVTVFRSGGGVGRSAIGTTTTEADGSYKLAIAGLETNAMVSVRAPGAGGARVAIKVAPPITLGGPPAGAELAAAGGPGHRGSHARTTFTGAVGAAYAGALVALQSSRAPGGEQWRPIAFGRVDELGGYSITHAFRTPGETWIRAIVRPGPGNVPAASATVSYEIVAAQNPKLTIQSSSPLISFGQSVTISGVAAEAGGRPVELLARSAGGAFEQIASATTDAAGRYAFTRAPQQRTAYQVRDASARSITLFQGVSYRLEIDAPPTSAGAGQPVSFTGALAPASPGQQVQLERQYSSGIGFHVLARGVLAGASYSIAHIFDTGGSYVLRIKVDGDASFEGVASTPFTLNVTPISPPFIPGV
jgi:hypothetical protein